MEAIDWLRYEEKDLAEQANLSNYKINKMHLGENVTTKKMYPFLGIKHVINWHL